MRQNTTFKILTGCIDELLIAALDTDVIFLAGNTKRDNQHQVQKVIFLHKINFGVN